MGRIEAVNPHLDWPREQSVGICVGASHEAVAPPGLEVGGRQLIFEIEAEDGADVIGRGRHERSIIDAKRFEEKVAQKARWRMRWP